MTQFDELPDNPFEASTDDVDHDEQTDTTQSGSGPVGRLFDGNAEGPDVPELQSDYGFSRPWAIVCRGTLRASTGSRVPPIFEIFAGLGMVGMRHRDADFSVLSGDDNSSETPSPDGAPANLAVEDDG